MTSSDRPRLPAALKRAVLVEAGHRCAIPTCRQHPTQIHHIEGFARTREHRFVDLIALCATCHDRVTRGQIDQRSVRQYKANLAVLNSRYEPFERRILLDLANQGREGDPGAIVTAGGLTVLFGNLLSDGFVEEWDQYTNEKLGYYRVGFPKASRWKLTESGRRFAERVLGADPLELMDEETEGISLL